MAEETVEPVKMIYQQALEVLEKAAPVIEDEKQKEYFTKTAESIRVASGLVNGNTEKLIRLQDAAVRYANQAMFILFRSDKIDDELSNAFRELATPEFTGDEVRKYENARQERIDNINNMHQEIIEEQKDLDIFTAVIAGMSKEEAEAKMAEYEAQAKAAQQR